MKCPQCNNIMEEGNFKSAVISFYPGKKQKGIVKNATSLLGRFSLGLHAEGYLCKDCKYACFNY